MWLVTALFALIMATWSVVTPLYHAPDEKEHADAVMRLEEGRGWPSAATAGLTPEGVGAYFISPTARVFTFRHNFDPNLPAAYAPSRHHRPEWQDLSQVHTNGRHFVQQVLTHPPGYYWYEATILRAGGAAGWRWDITVSVMRLLSILLVLWLPLLAWATAWRITGNRLAGIAASVVPLGVPELSHIGSSVNNDTLVILTGAAVLLGLACAACGDRSKPTAVWVGLWLAVGLWTKAFALVLLPLVLMVYAGPWLRERWRGRGSADPRAGTRPWRRWLPDRQTAVLLGLTAGVAIAIGCWWYVVNEVRYGATQPPVPGYQPGTDIGDHPLLFLRHLVTTVMMRWWSSIGWSEIQLPWAIIIIATAALATLMVIGLVRSRGRRLALAMLLWPTVVTYLALAVRLGHYYLQTHNESGLAGRYLFIGFTGVATMVGAGCAVLSRKVARWTPLLLLAGALGIQAEAARRAVDRWWRPKGGSLMDAWHAFSAWSTWPVGVLWTGLSLLVILAVAAVVTLARTGAYGYVVDLAAAPPSTRRALPAALATRPATEPQAASPEDRSPLREPV